MSVDEGPRGDVAQLLAWAALEPSAARMAMEDAGWWTESGALSAADLALERADSDPAQAQSLLTLAETMAADLATSRQLDGLVAYATARLAVGRGDLGAAADALLAAQRAWAEADDGVGAARSELGLTQVLAMQGDFDAATAAANRAIEQLANIVAARPELRMLLARAQRNLGTVLVYQDRHAPARAAYLAAQTTLDELRNDGQVDPTELRAELGHVALNLASTHTFLDEPDAAEAALVTSMDHFETIGDVINRGRAATNLGRLYLRQGAYSAALAQFDRALVDLVGPTPPDPAASIDAWRVADELLLEHALAYIALNLFPEAELALERCEALFRGTGQPYELAQTRFTQGLLATRQRTWQTAGAALEEAYAIYQELGNDYWANRTQLVRAQAALAQGDAVQTATILVALSADVARMDRSGDDGGAAGVVRWDVASRFELLDIQCISALDAGDADAAAQLVASMANLLRVGEDDLSSASAFPHLRLRWLHRRGQVAQAAGDALTARRFLTAAVDSLDAQRATLPIEEVRTAFLDDKTAIYADLVLNLLDAPAAGTDEVAAAFGVVERARSRALLEQLMAALDSSGDGESEDTEIRQQRDQLRRQLHWLYNQLLGSSGSRRLDATIGRTLAGRESALRQLEWQAASRQPQSLSQAQPVALADLQRSLADDQQALLYFIADGEVMAFLVDRLRATVVRRLCTVADLEGALADLRFQMGRAEMGAAYVARRGARLLAGVQAVLARIYELVAAPLAEHLRQPRLLVAPYGPLHQVPFHALWDGTNFWVMRHEFTYAPSASIVVHLARSPKVKLSRFVGLAPTDPRIPQAEQEVTRAAQYFPHPTTYLGDVATVAQTKLAAAQADVLHLATHGLFRRDNSFFSALKLADGWLDVRQIYRLRTTANVVVLSACESGAGEVRGGDEVIGLIRGFLAAGAQQVVASLWNVHDATAAAFMGEFYAALTATDQNSATVGAAGRAATALASAQRWAIAQELHPYYWAPFIVVG